MNHCENFNFLACPECSRNFYYLSNNKNFSNKNSEKTGNFICPYPDCEMIFSIEITDQDFNYQIKKTGKLKVHNNFKCENFITGKCLNFDEGKIADKINKQLKFLFVKYDDVFNSLLKDLEKNLIFIYNVPFKNSKNNGSGKKKEGEYFVLLYKKMKINNYY